MCDLESYFGLQRSAPSGITGIDSPTAHVFTEVNKSEASMSYSEVSFQIAPEA